MWCRGEKDEEHRADIVDENEEQSEHFDEEANPGSCNRAIVAGSSRAGDRSKYEVIDNKNVGKDGQRKKI